MNRLGSSLLALGLGLLTVDCSGGSIGGLIAPPDEEVTLLDVQAQIFSPSCALSGCHVGEDAPFGLDLSSGVARGNLVNVASAEIPELLRIEPFDAANSYLFMKVVGDPQEINGDPMPLGGDPLSAGDLTLLENWIEQGAN